MTGVVNDLPPYEQDAVLLYEYTDSNQACGHCGVHPTVREYGPYRVRRSLWRWLRRSDPSVVAGTFSVELCDEWE